MRIELDKDTLDDKVECYCVLQSIQYHQMRLSCFLIYFVGISRPPIYQREILFFFLLCCSVDYCCFVIIFCTHKTTVMLQTETTYCTYYSKLYSTVLHNPPHHQSYVAFTHSNSTRHLPSPTENQATV